MIKITPPRILTIAGSDSSGGAGIQGDLKTFAALECYGVSAITALTAQNTQGVQAVYDISVEFIEAQITSVLNDIGVDAIKIGMLHKPEVILMVWKNIKSLKSVPIVLDPVMVSKSGQPLLESNAVEHLKKYLFPLATVITPNLPEAAVLLNRQEIVENEIEEAAHKILDLGSRFVVLKGGHATSNQSNDYICYRNEKRQVTGQWLKGDRVDTINTHGTGCTFSSAIAAYLGRKEDVISAVTRAKAYLSQAISSGSDFTIGKGQGPVHHFFKMWTGI